MNVEPGDLLAVLTPGRGLRSRHRRENIADEEELVRQANDTHFGLATGIWTRDIQMAHRVAHALKSGTVWVNSYRTVSFDAPFGGYKMSGLGRENGLESIREYAQVKSVWVELSGQTGDPFSLG